jgi:hypothetical protein
MRHRLVGICIALLFGFALSAVAGSAASGGAQVAPTDNSSVSTYKVTDTSVGASARDSAGASSSQASGPASTNNTNASSTSASATNASSSNGAASSNGNGSSGYGISPRGTTDSNQVSTAIAREKVIDTGDKAVDTAKPAKAESSDKTFAPGLLDTVGDISVVGAQKEHASGSKADESKSAASENKNDSHK